ncbi:MAG: ROK family protein [Sphaerochaetaceae bacterium]
MDACILGVDAGGQSFKSTILDYESLEPMDDLVYVPVDSNGTAEHILGVFREVVRQGVDRAHRLGCDLRAVAFSCPGPLDYYRGISLMDHKWKAIKGLDLIGDLHSHGLAPQVPVFFCHDAHSLILGEIASGEAKLFQCVGGFIIGTGLGFGIIRNGQMEANALGSPRFGFFKRPYRDATIEAYAASKGVPRWYNGIVGKETDLDARQIGVLAQQGDSAALEAYHSMGKAIAATVADLVDEYEIDCLVFGGRISNSFAVFGPAFSEELTARCKRVPYLYRSLGSEVLSMQGAALYAKRSAGKRGCNEKIL